MQDHEFWTDKLSAYIEGELSERETEAIREHLTALHRWVVDAWLGDEREELIWLALAIDQIEEARESRKALLEGHANHIAARVCTTAMVCG